VSNNIWTFGQQHLVFGKIEHEEEAKKEEDLARRAANAPAPGAKPVKGRKNAAADADGAGAGDASEAAEPGPQPPDSGGAGTNGAGKNRTPRPGARPAARSKKRKR